MSISSLPKRLGHTRTELIVGAVSAGLVYPSGDADANADEDDDADVDDDTDVDADADVDTVVDDADANLLSSPAERVSSTGACCSQSNSL